MKNKNCPRCNAPSINKKRWFCGTKRVNKKDLDPLLDNLNEKYISITNVCTTNIQYYKRKK